MIKDREYFRKRDSERKSEQLMMDSYVVLAERYMKIYEVTKNIRWLKPINEFALKMNQRYCDEGIHYIMGILPLLVDDIEYLENYSKRFGE